MRVGWDSQKPWQGWCTDGEPAELLAGTVCKSTLFPALRTIFRCNLHSAQRTMEMALRSDSRIDKLLTAVVTKFSSDSGTGPSDLVILHCTASPECEWSSFDEQSCS